MSAHNILIIEDQRDLGRMLRAGLQSLGPDFTVVDVPSGEEALLVAKDRPFHLLITDIHLPGMSGFELLKRYRARQPATRVILITGLTDHKIRAQMANVGADAFFFKPLELGDLLDAVRRCLGLTPAVTPPPPPEAQEEAPSTTVAERLSLLRRQLRASSAVLLDDRGKPLVQAGEFPDPQNQESIILSLMTTFSAGAKVSQALETRPPLDVHAFHGQRFDLFMAHVGETYALVVTTKKSKGAHTLAQVCQTIQEAVSDLQESLAQMGVPLQVEEEPRMPSPELEEVVEEEVGPDLEALFQQAASLQLSPEEVNAFWETPSESIDTGSLNADDLSYDQAQKLGLTPNQEES